MSEIPRREVRDPRVLRALAHPVRLRLLEELVARGRATATELAESVGESPANCSWHLRQLARYGYVEEAGGGTGRQRPWRPVIQINQWVVERGDTEMAVARDAAFDVLLANELAALRQWHAHRASEPPDWRDGACWNQSVGWLTAEELKQVSDEMQEILTRHIDRIRTGVRPPGSRLVRFVAWGVPRVENTGDVDA